MTTPRKAVRTTTTRFRDVPWEEVEPCFGKSVDLYPEHGSRSERWARWRGKNVPLDYYHGHDGPRDAACRGPFWRIELAFCLQLGMLGSVSVCAHMIEID